MCGIAGFNWNDPELAKRMADEIRHRGPDQSGVHCAEGVSLAHRRLSIIDLSEHGRQPMRNEDGTVHLVFNGEIYNFRELRTALESKGHQFTSDSDSESIVHAYEEYGIDCLRHLRGMFAFALWDAGKQALFLARDRIGIKPLYWHYAGRRFTFASEIKALLKNPAVPRDLDPQALFDYLGFEFTPAPATMFAGIHKLPAGHYALLREDRLDVKPYWDLRFTPQTDLSFDAACERQMELLDDAVRSHLVSDVPLGVFLSGGLDSSALVAMMRRHIPGSLKTFTIGYRDKSFSEVGYAKQVADYFGTDHTVLTIDGMTPDSVEQALWHLDEPMTDLSAVPLMLVCREARKHVTVCLSGEGGDESFAGYDRFKASRINRAYALLPQALRDGPLRALARALPDRPQKKGAINMLKRFIEGSCLHPDGQHLRWQYFLDPGLRSALFTPRFRDQIDARPFRQIAAMAAACDAEDAVNREIYLDMRFMMTDSVLMKVDKMSMASSMEVRVPLLDHPLVEFIASLPGRWKLKGLTTKHVLRRGLTGALPDNIVKRGKQGYSLPVKHLLRHELKDYMTERLNESPLLRAHFDMPHVNRLIEEHAGLVHNHNHILWALLNVAIWHQRFMEKN
jgi:asparagine synthase (glutamine-hydrolysing)